MLHSNEHPIRRIIQVDAGSQSMLALLIEIALEMLRYYDFVITSIERAHDKVHTQRRFSQFLLFSVVLLYKVTVNMEITNTAPLPLGKNRVKFL